MWPVTNGSFWPNKSGSWHEEFTEDAKKEVVLTVGEL